MFKNKSTIYTVGIAIWGLLCQSPMFAGSVITENLPDGTAIVNIDSRSDGAVGRDSNCDKYFAPMNAQLSYAVKPGVYRFRVINKDDAAKLYPTLRPEQLQEIGQAWSYFAQSHWQCDCLVFDQGATKQRNVPQLFKLAPVQEVSGVTGFTLPEVRNGWVYRTACYTTSRAAYEAAKNGNYFNKVCSNGQYSNFYTFRQPTVLVFAVPDNQLQDNSGTVSVVISKETAMIANDQRKHIGIASIN